MHLPALLLKAKKQCGKHVLPLHSLRCTLVILSMDTCLPDRGYCHMYRDSMTIYVIPVHGLVVLAAFMQYY